jgi:hypothetical protein
MPTDFACQTCALHFSVGWFHYHFFETGYGSQTFFVCTACGAQHAIQIALRDRGPEFRETYNVELTAVRPADRIFALRLIRDHCQCTPAQAKALLEHLPVCLAQRVHPYQVDEWKERVSKTSVVLAFPVVDRTLNESFGPLMPDRLLGALQPRYSSDPAHMEAVSVVGPLGTDREIDVARQACKACEAIGTLSADVDVSNACPNCKHTTLEIVGAWIT